MSTLKATNLQHASAASPNIVLDTSGNATFAGNGAFTGTVSMGSPFAMRNKIINGAMEIDQRNAGASVTLTNSVAYVIDRWRSVALGTSLGFSTVQSTTAPAKLKNSLLATVTTAKSPASTDQARVNQYIEGFNVIDLAWGTASALPVTLSFWVRSSVTGTYCVSFTNADSATRSYVATYTINSANTFEFKTITVPGDITGTWTSSNSVGLGVSFSLGSGSSFNAPAASTWYGAEYHQTSAQTSWINNSGATFYLTGVQLEVGSVATPFERRLYTTELQLAQRYYEAGRFGADGYSLSGGALSTYAFFKVEKRSAPTITNSFTYNLNASGGVSDNIGTSSFRSYVIASASSNVAWINNYTASIEL